MNGGGSNPLCFHMVGTIMASVTAEALLLLKCRILPAMFGSCPRLMDRFFACMHGVNQSLCLHTVAECCGNVLSLHQPCDDPVCTCAVCWWLLLQVDDSHTVKDLIKTVAEKIGESHMFMYICRWIYVLTRC